jgi:hypothetical protein
MKNMIFGENMIFDVFGENRFGSFFDGGSKKGSVLGYPQKTEKTRFFGYPSKNGFLRWV